MRGFNDAKIDKRATNGLLGVEDSLAYRVEKLEQHFINTQYWRGKSLNQFGNNWADNGLIPFVATSGNGVYGADPNDEAKVLGTDDTPFFLGSTYYNCRKFLIVETSDPTVYKIRIVWGTTNMAAAIAGNQFSTIMFSMAPKESARSIDVISNRLKCGADKIWVQCKNMQNDATVSFFIGMCEYKSK